MKDRDMDDNALDESMVDQLRADAEMLVPDGADVDALVLGALRQGRRRRTRRRIVKASAGLVAAAAVAIAVAVIAPGVLQRGTTGAPIAASPSAVPSTRSTQSSSASPTPNDETPTDNTPTDKAATAATDSVRAGVVPGDVRDTLSGLLPDAQEVVDTSVARDKDTNGFPWELVTDLRVRDAKGTSYVSGGVGDDYYTDACFNRSDCTVVDVAGGGTLWIVGGPPGDKTGVDRWYYYNRPGGGHIWVGQRTYRSGAIPPTRNGLPLSDATARRIVTSPTWDALFGS